jgi:hypothetical protein
MTVQEDIAAEIATLEREVPVPVGALGYGTDLSCVTDVTEKLDEVDPNSVEGIQQGLIRRATTPRGSLPDDLNYGLNLRGYLNRGVTTQELRDLATQLRNEWRKDDRVIDVAVQVTSSRTAIRVQAQVTPADPTLEPFALVFAVTADGVELEETIT